MVLDGHLRRCEEGTVRFPQLKVRRVSAVVFGTPPEVGLVLVQHAVPVSPLTVVVAIDVGKNEFAVSVTTAARRRLLKPRLGCPMTAPSVREVVSRISSFLPSGAVVKVGIEAAGHYHLPLLAAALWPTGWELLELNPSPCHRTAQGAREADDQD